MSGMCVGRAGSHDGGFYAGPHEPIAGHRGPKLVELTTEFESMEGRLTTGSEWFAICKKCSCLYKEDE